MARSPAPNVHPRDPVLGPLKGFLDWVHRRLDAEIPALVTVTTSTWDPPNIASGSSTSTTLTVPGVDNDIEARPIMVASSQPIPAGCILTGAVTGRNEVTVTLANLSGGAVNVGPIAVLRVCAWRYGA